jgi:tripartite-type tricarboxylate transporter receptor subunit TctC
MKFPRREFLRLAAGAAALPAMSRMARAQTYPGRPVRLIVPAAAGNTSDILARLLGQWLSERLGQPFIIENRPGAGTNIGTEAVVRSAPDAAVVVRGVRNTHPSSRNERRCCDSCERDQCYALR